MAVGLSTGTSVWSNIVTWKVGATGPAVGTAFQVSDSNNDNEKVIQIAFGSMDSSKDDKDATNYVSTDGTASVSYGGNSYSFDHYASTDKTNGSNSNSLAADGSSTGNYIAFVPKYSGTVVVVVHNLGTGSDSKPTWTFEDGVAKSGIIIGSGSSNIAYDGQTDVKALNNNTNVTGGIKFNVSAGKTYTMSINGSKPRWMGIIYDYTNPWSSVYERGYTTAWSDDDVATWPGTTGDDYSVTKTAAGMQFDVVDHASYGNYAFEYSHSITTAADKEVNFKAVWSAGSPTGYANRQNSYIDLGGVKLRLYGQNSKLTIQLGTADPVNLMVGSEEGNSGTLRSQDFDIDITIHKATGEVEYSVSTSAWNSGTPVTGSGTMTGSVAVNSIKVGLDRNGKQFKVFSETLKKIQVKEKTEIVPVSVSAAGYATYVNSDYDLDFSATSIEAYKVKVSTKGVATLTKVDNVPAGTPVLLYKDGGATEDIPMMSGAAAVTGNDLVAGTGATVATIDGDYTNMILNNVSGIGFYFANGQTVATNRAYLHIATTLAPDASGGSRMTMVFGDDATSINTMLMNNVVKNNEYFDLQGRRVVQPQKGLYIVNGKKVIVK